MSTAPASVSDMLITVKSREVQRALLAEMRGDREAARLQRKHEVLSELMEEHVQLKKARGEL